MKPGETYLAFVYTDDVIVGPHCTHCYFGPMTTVAVDLIVREVNYFVEKNGPLTLPRITFDVPAFFGPDKDTRVLLTRDVMAFDRFHPLRQLFLAMDIMSGGYPFRPHITSGMGSFNAPFIGYALVRNGEIYFMWNIYEEKSGEVA